MTTIHEVSPRTCSVRRPVNRPVQGIGPGRDGLAGSRRPGPSRPAGAPLHYRGTGISMSVAPRRRRPVTLATTLWLGLVASIGQMANGDSAASAAPIPDRLAVVRVEPGESLQDVAHRVAPDAS